MDSWAPEAFDEQNILCVMLSPIMESLTHKGLLQVKSNHAMIGLG